MDGDDMLIQYRINGNDYTVGEILGWKDKAKQLDNIQLGIKEVLGFDSVNDLKNAYLTAETQVRLSEKVRKKIPFMYDGAEKEILEKSL